MSVYPEVYVSQGSGARAERSGREKREKREKRVFLSPPEPGEEEGAKGEEMGRGKEVGVRMRDDKGRKTHGIRGWGCVS